MNINVILDYKNVFLSKKGSEPYRSGMDKRKLEEKFQSFGYKIKYFQFSDIDFNKMNFKNEIVLYTSSEDIGFHYKSFIEDIIFGLKIQGAILIPKYEFLRANNNKVFMEIYRKILKIPELSNPKSIWIGIFENLKRKYKTQLMKWNGFVIKESEGCMSRGVYLALNFKNLLKKAKKISKTRYFLKDLKDLVRKFLFKGYKLESKHRKKFIIQEFIPNLKNDWKVLVFWDKIYILKRYTRKNDFRSSGSGNFIFDKNFPKEILEYSYKIRRKLKVPCISLDICYDQKNLYVLEYQALYFGTTTLVKAPFYYKRQGQDWKCIEKKSILEYVYAYCIHQFIQSFQTIT